MNLYTCPLASVSRKLASLFAAGAVLGWGAGGASAQVLDPCPVLAEPFTRTLLTRTACPLQAGRQDADGMPLLSPGRAFLYSALLPGLGQRKLGKGRWLAYLAVEAAAWIAFHRSRPRSSASAAIWPCGSRSGWCRRSSRSACRRNGPAAAGLPD